MKGVTFLVTNKPKKLVSLFKFKNLVLCVYPERHYLAI